MRKAIIFIALLLTAAPLFAQTYDGSAVGATAVTAPNGLFLTTATGPTIKFRSFSTGTVVMRYNVTNTYGSGTSKTPPWTTLWSSFTDDSSLASVTVKLFQVDKCSNTETQICSITSTDGSLPQCDSCAFASNTFDFANNSYYVEVTLSRSSTSGTNAELHSVAIN